MPKFRAYRTLLLPAIVFAGAIAFVGVQDASAQQGRRGNSAVQGGEGYAGNYVVRGPRRRVGGYSVLTLSDIWGPAKMPPPPRDFGPHFDFPPAPLNGAPLHDPYPN
jgi:hypothetical protein